MTVYCEGNCHVWIGASSLCTCEAHKALPVPPGDRVAMMYGFPANYNPFSPPKTTPPTGSQTDVPIEQFKVAQAIKDATHLSSDGQRVYSQRMGNVRVYYWDEGKKSYGSSFPCASGLPADAVVIERGGDGVG